MNAADRLRTMLDYERWANQRTLESIKSAEGGLLSQASRVGAAPDDIYNKHSRALATMGHILWARRRWLWRSRCVVGHYSDQGTRSQSIGHFHRDAPACRWLRCWWP